jgi:hypothetical protein
MEEAKKPDEGKVEPMVVITRTCTVTLKVPMSEYYDTVWNDETLQFDRMPWTTGQVEAYEKGHPHGEQVNRFDDMLDVVRSDRDGDSKVDVEVFVVFEGTFEGLQ